MPINRIQFQRGLSIFSFLERYGTDEQCRAALKTARWPVGFRCPRCQDHHHYQFRRRERDYFQCRRCRYQTSLVAGTIFQSTHLPLTKWFLAMYLMLQAKNNVAALELMRHLNVNYRTAWLVKHKLMQVMVEWEDSRVLEGRVEIDDAYLGGERAGKPGRGSPNKVPFVAAVQTTRARHSRYIRLSRVPSFTREAIDAWANQFLGEKTEVYSDGLGCFKAVAGLVDRHTVCVSGSGRPHIFLLMRVNSLLGNLKRALTGTYHAFKFYKYGGRYLAEYQFRFNQRFDLRVILPCLIDAAAINRPRPEWWIRLETEGTT